MKLTKKDKVLLVTMRRFNKDMDWVKLNHIENYAKIKEYKRRQSREE